MLPSCFFCPIAALDISPQSVTTERLLPPSSFVRLALEQKQLRSFLLCFSCSRTKSAFAVRTGLEPATPGVTGRYSNQLNYRTNCSDLIALFSKEGCKDITFYDISYTLLIIFFASSSEIGEKRQNSCPSLSIFSSNMAFGLTHTPLSPYIA